MPRPRYPLARIVEQTKDLSNGHDDPLVVAAAKNGDLNCDAELGPCKGFNEVKHWDVKLPAS